MLKKIVAEFLGTFFLVFAGTGAIIINQEMGGVIGHLGIALTFGLVVMAMILRLWEKFLVPTFNPAVSICLLGSRKISLAFPMALLGYSSSWSPDGKCLVGHDVS